MKNIIPFDSFAPVYKVLAYVGFYKILQAPGTNKYKHISHQIYRAFSLFVILLYSGQHLAFILQISNVYKILEALTVAIPAQNTISKFLALNLYSARIDKINVFLSGQAFAARGKNDAAILLKNQQDMLVLFKVVMIGATLGTILLPASNIFKRIHDESYTVLSYYPFYADTWTKFAFTVILETISLFWIGYGHLALDCLIATYFAQTIAQLKIIKCNLALIFDVEDEIATGNHSTASLCGNRAEESNLQRFKYYVERYEKLLWYSREVNDIFNGALSFQFLTSSISICLVVYQLSTTPFSVSFMFLLILLVVFLTQFAVYCFFGGLIKYESQSIVDAVYLSEWVSLSPKFRRLMLIAMLRWSRPIQPRVSAVVPLSLDTFISIVKFAYSLYTVLGTQR